MTIKYQYVKNKQGEVIDTITHIMSEHGHFEKDGHRQGVHIAGHDVDKMGFIEVIDEAVTHSFPDSFPDIIEEDEEAEADGGNED